MPSFPKKQFKKLSAWTSRVISTSLDSPLLLFPKIFMSANKSVNPPEQLQITTKDNKYLYHMCQVTYVIPYIRDKLIPPLMNPYEMVYMKPLASGLMSLSTWHMVSKGSFDFSTYPCVLGLGSTHSLIQTKPSTLRFRGEKTQHQLVR